MDSTHILYSPGKGHIYLSISSDTNIVTQSLTPQWARLDKNQNKTLEILL